MFKSTMSFIGFTPQFYCRYSGQEPRWDQTQRNLLHLVAVFVAHDYRQFLRWRDVVARREQREISLQIPANLDFPELE
jgi:hypothetical protein